MFFNRILAALAAVLIIATYSTGAARAGDTATLEVLGFSPDGRIFAFEEYGIQDGSGFPYANRYYIDTHSDTYLPETPFRARLEEDGASVEDVRGKVKALGETIIEDTVLARNTGFLAGSNMVTELSADPHRMVVLPNAYALSGAEAMEFRVEELPMDNGSCHGMGEAQGFRLLQVAQKPGEETRLVHEDKSIPTSRGCALGYRLHSVHLFDGDGAKPVFAVMLAVRKLGFEGPDYRFMAVTATY
ncbi:DUF2259 domain-containing protein [Nitratireductor basaltis]|uniref:Secreted protein n=1 Tax=Nitratireductor basaltis TaxID=472175 RepID=A0A084UBE6_9HYPH|nr:DUF2259 domain-containing protein [Nitratireductor basaltis]KFB10282.1 hypothetical protein EL18_01313 [Nitratireductor basaltis]